MDKNLGLGKGLSALMGDDFLPEEFDQPVEKQRNMIHQIPIDDLLPSLYQPRRVFSDSALEDLVQSIREKGVLQPLLVRHSEGSAVYEIIAGERRFRAAKIVGLKELPVIIKDLSNEEAMEVALIDNLQREDLNPLEEAAAYNRLMSEFFYTQDEVSRIVGKSRSHVANMLRLLSLPEEIKQLVENKEISIGHARALLTAKNATALAREIVVKGLSVRETEKLANSQKIKVPKPPKPFEKSEQKDAELIALERQASALLKTVVKINWNGAGGTIEVAYDTPEMMNEILQRLMADKSITSAEL